MPIVSILDPKLISQQRERAPMAADDPSDLEKNLWGLNSGGLVGNARWRWSDRQIAVIKGLCLQEIKSNREEKTTDNRGEDGDMPTKTKKCIEINSAVPFTRKNRQPPGRLYKEEILKSQRVGTLKKHLC